MLPFLLPQWSPMHRMMPMSAMSRRDYTRLLSCLWRPQRSARGRHLSRYLPDLHRSRSMSVTPRPGTTSFLEHQKRHCRQPSLMTLRQWVWSRSGAAQRPSMSRLWPLRPPLRPKVQLLRTSYHRTHPLPLCHTSREIHIPLHLPCLLRPLPHTCRYHRHRPNC